jgi:membrane protein YdbS with pleckstrin-like domain
MMTDGGDGARGDGTDRLAGDDSGADTPAAGSVDGGQAPPELAEPTRARLAREQTKTAELDRGPITEYTTDRRSLASTVQIQWTIRIAILALVLGVIGGAILSTVRVPMEFGLLGIGVFLGLGLAWVVLSYRVWIYQIRDDSLYLERGVVTHVRTIVPYVRIQHVDTSRSALERALGLSTLVVYTAGSRGADVSIPGLKPNEARDLQQRLKELAIEADGDDAL